MENRKVPLDILKNDSDAKELKILDVVSRLMDSDNIELKTEIKNPYAQTTLSLIGDIFKQKLGKDDINHKTIKFWTELLLNYMVSNKRKGRSEIAEILKGFVEIQKEKERVNATTNLANL